MRDILILDVSRSISSNELTLSALQDNFAGDLAKRLAVRTVGNLERAGHPGELSVEALERSLRAQINDEAHYDTIVNLEYANR